MATSVNAAALNITFSAPTEVETGEEFEVTIDADTTETQDVKISILETGTTKTASEIYNGATWKNSYYYLMSVFPAQDIFQLRVKTFVGTSEICVQLRKHGQSASSKECLPITINQGQMQEPPADEPEEPEEEGPAEATSPDVPNTGTTTRPPMRTNISASNKPAQTRTISTSTQQVNSAQSEEPVMIEKKKIVLGSSHVQETIPMKEEVYVTPEGRTREVVIYSFGAFCIVLTLLIALRRV